MHKRRGCGEEEFHSDSECKLVVEDRGWKVGEKEAGSGGEREEQRCTQRCDGLLQQERVEDGCCDQDSDSIENFINPISPGLDRKTRLRPHTTTAL